MNAADSATVAPAERLGFGLFVGAAVHLLVIFGVGFSWEGRSHDNSGLHFDLVQHYDDSEPDSASVIAQAARQASGDDDDDQLATTEEQSLLSGSGSGSLQPQPTAMRQAPPGGAELITSITGLWTVHSRELPRPTPSVAERILREQRRLQEMRSALLARLGELREARARSERVRTLTSTSAASAAEAEYLVGWQQRVEQMGTSNYPPESRRRNIWGSLRLLVSLNADGGIVHIEILQSSGSAILDRAAVRIVRLAAPFDPLPGGLERLNIIRSWNFEPGMGTLRGHN